MVRKKKHKAMAPAQRLSNVDGSAKSPHTPAAAGPQVSTSRSQSSSRDDQQPSCSGASSGNPSSSNSADRHQKLSKHTKEHGTNRYCRQASASSEGKQSHQSAPKYNHHSNHHKCSNSESAQHSSQTHGGGRVHRPHTQGNPRHLQIHPPNSLRNSRYAHSYRGDRRRNRNRRAGRQPWRDLSAPSNSQQPTTSQQIVSNIEQRHCTSTTNSSPARGMSELF